MNILRDLQRFRCLTRDNIIDLHFSKLKTPITSCNTVLKRMRRDGHIEVNTNQQPYIYFPSQNPIKKDSAKIPHFLAIAQFYISLLKYQEPKLFIVEPKYSKGYMEPDVFMIWKNAPFFVEIQRSIYSKKVMTSKFERYMSYYSSKEWENEQWQPKDKKVFPRVLILTDSRYELDKYHQMKIIQVQNVHQLISQTDKPKIIEIQPGIKVSIGSGIKIKES